MPSQNTRVRVKLQYLETSSFPLPQCKECEGLFQQSGIVQAVGQIMWNVIDTTTYNLLETVSVLIQSIWCGKGLALAICGVVAMFTPLWFGCILHISLIYKLIFQMYTPSFERTDTCTR